MAKFVPDIRREFPRSVRSMIQRTSERPSDDDRRQLATVADNRLKAEGAASWITTYYSYDLASNLSNYTYTLGRRETGKQRPTLGARGQLRV